MILSFCTSVALAGDLLVVDARVWDGSGAPVQDGVWLLVRDGRLEELGVGEPPDPAVLGFEPRVLDVEGATVLPGLIDAHVHLTAVPGAPWRGEDEAAHLPHIRAQLPAYLAAGVTSVLDTGIFPEGLRAIRAELAGGLPGPRVLSLGPVLAPAGGYPAAIVDGFPELASVDDVTSALDELVALEAVGVKATVESGFVREVWPLYSDEVLDALRDQAGARSLPIYVHATSADEQQLALERLAPHAFVHQVEDPNPELVAALAASGAYVMPTMALMDAPLTEFQVERLDDPWLRALVPPLQLQSATDAVAIEGWHRDMIRVALPGLPGWLQGWAASVGVKEELWLGRLAAGQAVTRTLHEAGVPIVLGSDAGSYEQCPFYFHGVSSIRELELLAESIGAEAALVAATRTPAEMLGRDDLGTLEVGKRADFVVVGGDPLVSVRALRDLRYTVVDGVAGEPAEWLAGGPE